MPVLGYLVWFVTTKKQLHTVDDDIDDNVGDDDSCLKMKQSFLNLTSILQPSPFPT